MSSLAFVACKIFHRDHKTQFFTHEVRDSIFQSVFASLDTSITFSSQWHRNTVEFMAIKSSYVFMNIRNYTMG